MVIIIIIHCKFSIFCFHYRFASHVLLFQDALTFRHGIALCYSSQFVALQNCVFFPIIWVVCEAVVSVLSSIVSNCVLN
jgi:hypothetical protein